MAWITTPRSLDQFAELYHQIGGMLTSGVTLVQALELVRAAPPASRFRGRLDRILGELKQGSTFSEALEQQRGWLPEFDVALISAGEKSGRLDACCHRLSDYYRDRAKLLRGLLSDLAYPAFLIFLVILVFPPGSLARLVWQGDVAGFVLPRLKVVAVFALAGVLIQILNRSSRGGWWRGVWEAVLHRFPVLGRARRSMALARLAMALEANGQPEAGREALLQALDIAAQTHNMFTTFTCLPAMVDLLARRGQLDSAMRVHRLALRVPFHQTSRWYACMVGDKMDAQWETLPEMQRAAIDASINQHTPFSIIPDVIQALAAPAPDQS